MNNIRKSFLDRLVAVSAALAFAGTGVSAQDIYDDIYYNPKDDASVKATSAVAAAQTQRAVVAKERRERSVDEYNRRGIFASDTTVVSDGGDAAGEEAFGCTRRIERFYNPDVIVESTDPTLAEVYYAEPANINIIVNTPSWGWPAYSSLYSPWGYYYPGAWGWGPSWSWNWSPSWSWAWGPSWGWTSPGWGPSWGWGYPRPYNPRHPGAIANHGRPGGGRPGGNPQGGYDRPSFGGGGSGMSGQRPSANGGGAASANPGVTRPSGTAASSGHRPSSSGNMVGGTGVRPGSLSHGFTTGRDLSTSVSGRPSSTSGSVLNNHAGGSANGQRPSYNVNSGRGTYTPSTSNGAHRPVYKGNGSVTNNNTRPSYNTNNSNNSRPSYNNGGNSGQRPSYNSGSSHSRNSGGFSGGGRSGGGRSGGGSRGGRH